MANSNPSIEEVREGYREHNKKQSIKVKEKDTNLREGMEEVGIDVEELNRSIDKGDFNFASKS